MPLPEEGDDEIAQGVERGEGRLEELSRKGYLIEQRKEEADRVARQERRGDQAKDTG